MKHLVHVTKRGKSGSASNVSLARSLVPRRYHRLYRIEDDAKITEYLSVEAANGRRRLRRKKTLVASTTNMFRVECIRYEEFFIIRPPSIEQCFFCLNYTVAHPPRLLTHVANVNITKRRSKRWQTSASW